jgi:hypothetical protein
MATPDENVTEALRGMRLGMLLAFLGALFGFGLGGAFGAFEDPLKAGLKADAEAVLATTYAGDPTKMKEVLDKSWAYYKRAHMHGGAIGAAALASILAVALVGGGPRRLRRLAALGLGIGALGYPIFWLLAGARAPGLGSTGAAKDSLEWLAVPTAGMALVGLVLALVTVVWGLYGPPRQPRP